MKSSRERMRKDEMQLTISLMPLAIESNRLFPSEGEEHHNDIRTKRPVRVSLLGLTRFSLHHSSKEIKTEKQRGGSLPHTLRNPGL